MLIGGVLTPYRLPMDALTGLLRGFFRRRLAADVFPFEALHPPFRIHDLLRTGEEGVAIRADFQLDVSDSRAGFDLIPTSAADSGHAVFGVNSGFHVSDSSKSNMSPFTEFTLSQQDPSLRSG
jgi:hypothetical protein